jgi:two-component sensor histidine kinase
MITFSVHDDGPGFPDGFDPEAQQTLGMQLLRALTRQLDGTLEWQNNGGACLCIRFPRRIKRLQRTGRTGIIAPITTRRGKCA